jgi:hypothetical protein
MSADDRGPLIPSWEELDGREMDSATEGAARYALQADRLPTGTPEAEHARRQANLMKEHVAGLRERPLSSRFRPLVWDTPVDYRSLPPVELKPRTAEEYERAARGMRDLAAVYPPGSESSVWHLEQAEFLDEWAAEARAAEDEGRAR